MTAAIGAGLGYPLTGLIAQLFGFRAAFWFGAIAVGLALILRRRRPPGTVRRTHPDVRHLRHGALGLAVIGVSIVLSEGGEWGWTSAWSTRDLAAVLSWLVWGWVRHELRVATR